jgi:hypothetical protein
MAGLAIINRQTRCSGCLRRTLSHHSAVAVLASPPPRLTPCPQLYNSSGSGRRPHDQNAAAQPSSAARGITLGQGKAHLGPMPSNLILVSDRGFRRAPQGWSGSARPFAALPRRHALLPHGALRGRARRGFRMGGAARRGRDVPGLSGAFGAPPAGGVGSRSLGALCGSACNCDPGLEYAPAGGQNQAAALTVCWAC